MIKEQDNYYFKQPEPIQSCLLALKDIILRVDENITHERKYQIPFFCYKGMNLAFLWVQKKKIMVGFLIDKRMYPAQKGIKRKDNMETILLNPNEDIPIEFISENIQKRLAVYSRVQVN